MYGAACAGLTVGTATSIEELLMRSDCVLNCVQGRGGIRNAAHAVLPNTGATVEQRFTFDEVAELYDRRRPSYPEALVEDLLVLSGIPSDGAVLEIGCGTGQLTSPIARRGYRVLCLEPGRNLAVLADRNLSPFPLVRVVNETFEDASLQSEAFDLVVAAQSFHWVAPEVRFKRAAEVLRRTGSLGIVGNVSAFSDSPVDQALQQAYVKHASHLSGARPTQWYGANGPLPDLFKQFRSFVRMESRRYPWSQTYSAVQYTELLSTHSDHRLLPPAQREALLHAIGEAIDRHGGSLTIMYESHLHLGTRAAAVDVR
jgi:SAM-dependent methyltransferase